MATMYIVSSKLLVAGTDIHHLNDGIPSSRPPMLDSHLLLCGIFHGSSIGPKTKEPTDDVCGNDLNHTASLCCIHGLPLLNRQRYP
jgi:hypothetical protein